MDYRGLTRGCGGCAARRARLAHIWAAIDPTKAINLHPTRSTTERQAQADLIGGLVINKTLLEAASINWSGGSGIVQVVFADDAIVRTTWSAIATYSIAGDLSLSFSSEFGLAGNTHRECGNFAQTPPDNAKNVFHPDGWQIVSFGTLPTVDPGEITRLQIFGGGSKIHDVGFDPSCRDSPIQDDRRYGLLLQTDSIPAFGSQAGGTAYPMCLGGTTTFTNEKTLTVTATITKTVNGVQFKTPALQRAATGLSDHKLQDNPGSLIGFDFYDTVVSTAADPCWRDIPAQDANDPIGRIRATDNGATFTYSWDLIWEDGQEPTFSGSIMNF